MRKTHSSTILEHLRSLPEGKRFTSADILDQIPDATPGAVSGLLCRLKKEGHLTKVGIQKAPGSKGVAILQLSANAKLDQFGYRLNRPDEVKGNHSPRKRASEPLHDCLLQLADELNDRLLLLAERASDQKTTLQHYTTEELIEEIGRRVKEMEH